MAIITTKVWRLSWRFFSASKHRSKDYKSYSYQLHFGWLHCFITVEPIGTFWPIFTARFECTYGRKEHDSG